MSAIGDGVGGREDRGEVVEQRGGPVEGQRFVDGPDATARLALPDGGEGLADRGRVVAVVVEDDDPGGLALSLQPPTDARERREAARDDGSARHAEAERRRRDAERVGGVVAADERQPDAQRRDTIDRAARIR